MKLLRALSLSLSLAACGGLDNRPLQDGAVRGHISGCEPGIAVAGHLGGEVKGFADATCNFRIDRVPAGDVELYVVGTSNKVVVVPAHIEPVTLSEVGDLATRPGSQIRVRAKAPGRQAVHGTLSAPGLPLPASTLDANGMGRLGPFPTRCFDLELTVAGLGTQSLRHCFDELVPEETVDVDLASPDGSVGSEGCRVSGCEAAAVCQPDGSCQ